ncbi:glycosyltransferase 87 family protein [Agromyces sp. LHK192]|uniref:glycosyltransferase 87 family protein n=1 Tax=Agromyces sp. LHK192 TaxID=2498704 RepID=UPI000FDBFB39|nr:glycosyltransferase 87 family protein [Agromyces sp. LHK192]
MTVGPDGAASARPRPSMARRIVGGRLALWVAFLAVHATLVLLNLHGQGWPLGDVEAVYLQWAQQAANGWLRMGIDSAWVYPILAFAPMAVALAFGPAWYPETWLGLVSVLDAVAFAILLGGAALSRTRRIAAWWWLAFLLLLGPIALGRIDAVTVPIALVGMLFAFGRPRVAAALLTIATWIKVWPAALLAALVVAHRRRMEAVMVAVALSTGIVGVSLVAGSGLNVFGFIGEQTGRGLQVEAPIGVFWLWSIVAGSGESSIGYDRDILTYQISGPGVEVVSSLTTPVMALAAIGAVLVGVRAVRRGAAVLRVLAPLALTLVVVLMLANKVGSPQFATWLAAPVVLGLATDRRRFLLPALLAALVAATTQVIYPYWYGWLLAADPAFVLVLTLKAALLAVIAAWGVRTLWQAGSRRTGPPAIDSPIATARAEEA